MRKSKRYALMLPLLILCAFSSTTLAQQSASLEINKGTVTIQQLQFPSVLYNFYGPAGTEISGYIPPGDGTARPSCAPCVAGETVTVDGSFFTESPLSTVTLNSGPRELYVTSALTLNGASFVIPYRYSRPYIRITVPATLNGSLTGYTRNPNVGDPGPPVFSLPLNLTGTVTVTLVYNRTFSTTGRPFYGVNKITYNFAPVEPVEAN